MKRIKFIFLCMLCMTFAYNTTMFAQQDEIDIKYGVRNWMSDHNLDTIPVIIFNEREITLEEFSHLPTTCFGTYEGYLPPFSVELLGEKGKRGVLYVNTKRHYIPLFPSAANDTETYYYTKGDRPVEFPGGDFAEEKFLRDAVKVRPELDSLYANVYVNCFFDEEGNCEKSEISHIQIAWPQAIDVRYGRGKRADTDLLSEKFKSYLDMLKEDALVVVKKLPQYQPATFWLQHVKYKKEIRLFFVGKKAKRAEYNY